MKIRADRRGFTGEIPLVLKGLPEGLKVEGTNIPANASELVMKLTATAQTPPTTNATLSLEGEAMFNDRLYRHKPGGVKIVIAPPAAMELAATNAVVAPKQP